MSTTLQLSGSSPRGQAADDVAGAPRESPAEAMSHETTAVVTSLLLAPGLLAGKTLKPCVNPLLLRFAMEKRIDGAMNALMVHDYHTIVSEGLLRSSRGLRGENG